MKKLYSIFLAIFMMFTMSTTAFAQTSGIGVEPGQSMPDFTVNLTDGTTTTLSDLLKEKDVVVLNIFASWCKPCEKEFPEMEEVYEANKEHMEIVSLSGDPEDTMQMIADYKESHSLTFPMGLTENNLDFLSVSGFPTSVIIDRNGKVGFIKVGAFESKEDFETKVNYFLSPNYDGKPLQTEKAISLLEPLLLFLAVWNLLLVAGRWILFRKVGKTGWHSMVPVLSSMEEYELCWKRWIGAVESLISLSPMVLIFIPGLDFLGPLVTWVPMGTAFAIRVVENMKLANAFGKGKLYGLFLTILRPFGRMALGLGKAEYQKNIATL